MARQRNPLPSHAGPAGGAEGPRFPEEVVVVACAALITVGTHMAVRGLAAWLRGEDLTGSGRPPDAPW